MSDTLRDPRLKALLAELHAKSEAQDSVTAEYFRTRPREGRAVYPQMDAGDHAHFADKLVALEPDKAEFCYVLCRAMRATRIVELGTSFGVSTIYLAAAVRDNGGGVVIGTENEAAKIAAARASFTAVGLADLIDLRAGDVRETLKHIEGPIDFVLFDIWWEAVGPALDLLLPHLHRGSVVCADNTAGRPLGYRALFEVLDDPSHGFHTTTLPFRGGFEMAVKS
ncbi:MAG: O-methyltransferase [Steroidobacteraceae bacterium]